MTVKNRRALRLVLWGSLMLCMLLPVSVFAAGQLLISEVCTDNTFVFSLGDNDYIEFHNTADTAVSLRDYTLTADGDAFALPDLTVGADGYVCVPCETDACAAKLKKSGCTLSLLDGAGVTEDEVSVPASRNQVWTREEGLVYTPTPGYPNTADGEKAYYAATRSGLIISEALPGNFRGSPVPKKIKRYADAVEITNIGAEEIDLSGYTLSDKRGKPDLYRFPSVRLKPGKSYVLYCTDQVTDNRCTGFKLSSEGEVLYLSRDGSGTVDALSVPPLPLDVSWGVTDGAHRYYAEPTLGSANGAGESRIAPKPVLSAGSGRCTEPFSVTVTGEGPFRYTTDGSEPTADSQLYSGPIPVVRDTELRVSAFPAGAVPSSAVTAVYTFNEEGYALPCLYLTVPDSYLSKDRDSLIRNAGEKGWEVPACATLISGDGTVLFSRDMGLSISGQTSRKKKYRGFKLNFRGRYGGLLRCKVFDDLDTDVFDSLIVRVGTTGNPIHDVFGASVGKDVMENVMYQHFRPVNFFLGGTYMGIYYLREHINERFVADRLGGDPDEADMVRTVQKRESGDVRDWWNLNRFCRSHKSLRDDALYEKVTSQINVDSFIDYYIWRPYIGDRDQRNLFIVRSQSMKDPRWQIIIHDMDWAFQSGTGLQYYVFTPHDSYIHNNLMIMGLMKNGAFRARYLARMSDLFANALTPERLLGILDDLTAELEPDLEKSLKAWGMSRKVWEKKLDGIRVFIAGDAKGKKKERRLILLEDVRKYLQLTPEEEQTYFPQFQKQSAE